MLAHHHSHKRNLRWVVLILTGTFITEYLGSVWANSQVLRADAFHMLSDVVAIVVSLIAIQIATRPNSDRYPFVLRRAEVFAALLNGLSLCVIVFEILREGLEAIHLQQSPASGLMMMVSLFAMVVNGFCVWIMHRADHAPGCTHGHNHSSNHSHGLNIRSAQLHLMGDLLGSMAAFAAAVIIRLGGPPFVDVIAAFAVAGILTWGAMRLLRASIRALLS